MAKRSGAGENGVTAVPDSPSWPLEPLGVLLILGRSASGKTFLLDDCIYQLENLFHNMPEIGKVVLVSSSPQTVYSDWVTGLSKGGTVEVNTYSELTADVVSETGLKCHDGRMCLLILDDVTAVIEAAKENSDLIRNLKQLLICSRHWKVTTFWICHLGNFRGQLAQLLLHSAKAIILALRTRPAAAVCLSLQVYKFKF